MAVTSAYGSPSGVSAARKSSMQALQAPLEADPVLLRERGLRVAEPAAFVRSLELARCLAQHRGADRARIRGILRLEEEEPRRAPVELLRHRPHLARAHDVDEAGALEDLQVVADGSLGDAELLGELLRRERALAEECDHCRSHTVRERAQLLRLRDDERVRRLVIRLERSRASGGNGRHFPNIRDLPPIGKRRIGCVSVLETRPPHFTADEAAAIAADVFGVEGIAVDLGSERDQTFLVADGAVLKISNIGEDPAVLDLERAAILHVLRVDPELPVARPLAERATFEGPDGVHHVRLFERLHGHAGGPELGDGAVRDFAATHARLNLALRSFFHPAAGRELLWDLEHTPKLRRLLDSIADAARRALVERAIDRFEEWVAPRWPRLRAQVVHGDLNLDNVLLDERSRVAGIVDFGDCGYTAQAGDFAVALASIMRGRPEDDVFRVARIAVDGYASRLPFEPLELEVLGDLVAARLAMIVAISSWRVRSYPENAEYIQAWDDDSWRLLELFDRIGADTVARELGAPRPRVATDELAQRRAKALGAVLTPLTYSEPVHASRGEGVWIYDADGNRLLDAYNNVPVVGHCHPRVTEAVVRQTRRLNTHARYLYEPLVELAERLLASMPPGTGLDTVMLVNSGSEANDVAWRIATGATGRRGAIVTEHAYHGVTAATADLSPEEWPDGFRPANVARIAPPGSGAGRGRGDGACSRRARRARGDVRRRRVHERRHLDPGARRRWRRSCGARMRREACSSPTRCRRATGGWASTSGRSRSTA